MDEQQHHVRGASLATPQAKRLYTQQDDGCCDERRRGHESQVAHV